MTRQQMREWGVFLLVLAVVLWLVHLWAWAIFDLSGKVNTAFDLTFWMLLGFAAIFTWAAQRKPKDPTASATA